MAEFLTGTMLKGNGKFGFIKQDSGEADMFVLPKDGRFLPEGTRVAYNVVTDQMTGRPRAEPVEPIDPVEQQAESLGQDWDSHAASQELEQMLAPVPEGSATGTVAQHKGSFGFIKQDSGEADMFMLPSEGRLPPIGSRVSYNIVTDSKTGRPRAEGVVILDGGGGGGGSGIGFGGGARVPPPYRAHQAPAYQAPAYQAPAYHAPVHQAPAASHAGTVFQINQNFGFIKQDNGEADMFVLHPSCAAFGGQIPVIGTRVNYEVVIDGKTGRPRAEDVRPEVVDIRAVYGDAGRKGGNAGAGFSAGCGKGAGRGPAPRGPGARHSGTVMQINNNFGFIKPDDGGADMFVMHPSCGGFGGHIPPVGTRVLYDVVSDAKTGRPRAEDVGPEVAQWSQPSYGPAKGASFGPAKGAGKGAAKAALPYAPRAAPAFQAPPKRAAVEAAVEAGGPVCTGTMDKNSGRFGFIKQDSGEADMFMLPDQSGAFPPVGTRLQYIVITDPKTGRPRAEDVQVLSDGLQ